MSDTNSSANENEELLATLDRLKTNERVQLQTIIDAMETKIIRSFVESGYKLDYKGVWLKRIRFHSSEIQLNLDETKKPSWKNIDEKIQDIQSSSLARVAVEKSASDKIQSIKSTSAPKQISEEDLIVSSSSYSTSSSLKTRLSASDKEKVLKIYDAFISEPETCWYLETTKEQAELEKREPVSVESRMRDFVYTLNYVHPALSFILDTDDLNWRDFFNPEEIKELRSYGEPVLRCIPDCMKLKLEEMEGLNGALEAYNYGRNIEHHPIDQPLLAWLSQTLMQTSKFFIPGASMTVDNFLETDAMYYLWGLMNTIFHNSAIKAVSKEKTSNANASVLNCKRKLSAVDGIDREKMGRRVDTIYIGGRIELGGLEIGPTKDNTKGFKDSMFKLPFVLKDMLANIVNRRPKLLRKAHVLGYNINGTGIRLIDVDLPQGHVVRIRRVDELEYPTNNDDYVPKILSLLELAIYGKMIVDSTYALCCKTRVHPSVPNDSNLVPPAFFSTDIQSPSTSDSSSPSKKNCKKKSH